MSGRGKISKKLYVGNLSAEAGAEELREVFAAFGKLGEVVAKDGYGFVHFHDPDDAAAALEALDNSELCRQKILVQFSKSEGHGYTDRGSDPPPRHDSSRSRGYYLPPRDYARSRYDYDRLGSSRYDRYGYRDPYRDHYYSRPSYRDLFMEERLRDMRYRSRGEYDRYGREGMRRSRSPMYGSRDRDYDSYARDRSREREKY